MPVEKCQSCAMPMENHEALGIDEILLNVDYDEMGGANVARIKRYEKHIGPKSLLSRVSPEKYKQLSHVGMIELISVYVPEYDPS